MELCPRTALSGHRGSEETAFQSQFRSVTTSKTLSSLGLQGPTAPPPRSVARATELELLDLQGPHGPAQEGVSGGSVPRAQCRVCRRPAPGLFEESALLGQEQGCSLCRPQQPGLGFGILVTRPERNCPPGSPAQSLRGVWLTSQGATGANV